MSKIPAKVRRHITISCSLLIAAIGIFFVMKASFSAQLVPLKLNEITQIEHGVRVTAQPTHISNKNEIHIKINLESTEHTEALDLELDSISLIELAQGEPIEAKKWTVNQHDDFSKTGTLIFNPIPKESNTISLHIFGLIPKPFIWTLEKTPSENNT